MKYAPYPLADNLDEAIRVVAAGGEPHRVEWYGRGMTNADLRAKLAQDGIDLKALGILISGVENNSATAYLTVHPRSDFVEGDSALDQLRARYPLAVTST